MVTGLTVQYDMELQTLFSSKHMLKYYGYLVASPCNNFTTVIIIIIPLYTDPIHIEVGSEHYRPFHKFALEIYRRAPQFYTLD